MAYDGIVYLPSGTHCSCAAAVCLTGSWPRRTIAQKGIDAQYRTLSNCMCSSELHCCLIIGDYHHSVQGTACASWLKIVCDTVIYVPWLLLRCCCMSDWVMEPVIPHQCAHTGRLSAFQSGTSHVWGLAGSMTQALQRLSNSSSSNSSSSKRDTSVWALLLAGSVLLTLPFIHTLKSRICTLHTQASLKVLT